MKLPVSLALAIGESKVDSIDNEEEEETWLKREKKKRRIPVKLHCMPNTLCPAGILVNAADERLAGVQKRANEQSSFTQHRDRMTSAAVRKSAGAIPT